MNEFYFTLKKEVKIKFLIILLLISDNTYRKKDQFRGDF